MKKIESRSKWNANVVLRYLLVGAWNTLFSIILLYALFFFFSNKYYEYEFGATFGISTVQSYITQRMLVWKSLTSPKFEFSRFFVSTRSQYILNSILDLRDIYETLLVRQS